MGIARFATVSDGDHLDALNSFSNVRRDYLHEATTTIRSMSKVRDQQGHPRCGWYDQC